MIGRDGPVRPFELIRWARQQATVHKLRTLEAHVLLLLATYANDEAIAWPSIKTLALDSGLRPTKDGRNSAVSAALARLEELGLLWTRQGGHGHPAKRELLFNPREPSGLTEGSPSGRAFQSSGPQDEVTHKPSGTPDGYAPTRPGQPSGTTDAQPSGLADQKYQGNGHLQLPEGTARGSVPLRGRLRIPRPGRLRTRSSSVSRSVNPLLRRLLHEP